MLIFALKMVCNTFRNVFIAENRLGSFFHNIIELLISHAPITNWWSEIFNRFRVTNHVMEFIDWRDVGK